MFFIQVQGGRLNVTRKKIVVQAYIQYFLLKICRATLFMHITHQRTHLISKKAFLEHFDTFLKMNWWLVVY